MSSCMDLFLHSRYGTLFLPAARFPERGGMSLTTLLVLIALYSDASAALPKTSYIKFIDIWFVFGISFLSLIIFVHLATCKTDDLQSTRMCMSRNKNRIGMGNENPVMMTTNKSESKGTSIWLIRARYIFCLMAIFFTVAYVGVVLLK